MTAPEKTGSIETKPLATELPGTNVRLLTLEDLPEVRKLMESNLTHFAQGGIISDSLYTMIENELMNNNSTNQRMGIWKNGELVGYIGTNPTDEGVDTEVEVAYAIDEKHSGQGIASAAIDAVVSSENDKGNTVVAEVESRNMRSMRLLGKLGFEQSMRRSPDGRTVFIRYAMTEQEMMRRLGM